MADGNVWTTPNHPPVPSATERPSVSVATISPTSRPAKAPCPVVRFQNIPSRNVANNGAFTNPNTSCKKSMMLFDRAAQYAVPIESNTPTTVVTSVYFSELAAEALSAMFVSYMSGMAAKLTAFNTVFTYDINDANRA